MEDLFSWGQERNSFLSDHLGLFFREGTRLLMTGEFEKVGVHISPHRNILRSYGIGFF